MSIAVPCDVDDRAEAETMFAPKLATASDDNAPEIAVLVAAEKCTGSIAPSTISAESTESYQPSRVKSSGRSANRAR